MKKIFTLLLTITSAYLSATYAQEPAKATLPRLSAFTKQYFADRKQTGSRDILPGYVYKKINNKPYLSAFIKVNAGLDESILNGLGIYVGTKAGNIWTIQVPADNIDAITTINGIGYIDLDMPIFPLLDSARKQTRADSAQKGINLPIPVTGKNVIVGVIDAGFDYNHPTMYDTTYSKYRIQRVWAQKINGTPPAGFAYGNEMVDTNAIKTAGNDTIILSHGTHVAGIAAGSGYGSNTANSQYRGMAFESDIVLVGIMPAPSEWAVAGESDIIDGMNYIYKYAATVGKPAVINLSWGATIGPHDGNSLFNQACDALTGAGKIFVCAAGNNGEDTVHLQKIFTSTDTAVSTFVTFSPSLPANNKQTWVDVWGNPGNTFCFTVKLYNANTSIDSTAQICLADTSWSFILIGSNNDTCFVSMAMTDVEYNGKPHALLHFYSKVNDNICLTTKSTNGVVNMWEGYVLPPEGYYGYLKQLSYSWAVSGDANMTVSDIGCTKSAITAAAYTSKVSFKNISSPFPLSYPGAIHGKIAPFSSFGPTEDLRVKPDIAAPGFALASSVNSYDTSYKAGGTNYSSIVHAYTTNGKTYDYAMLAGTSMASPCVAGIVGMMLQLNPTLTPDSVKAILAATAITDTYTGILPAAGNTTWGHGKINAYRALRMIASNLSVENIQNADPLECILFPNPNKGSFTISYKGKMQEVITVGVYDISGRLINMQEWRIGTGYNTRQFNPGPMAKGIYLVKIAGASGLNTIKMIEE